MSENMSGGKIAIIVALIGAVGVITAAIITSNSKIVVTQSPGQGANVSSVPTNQQSTISQESQSKEQYLTDVAPARSKRRCVEFTMRNNGTFIMNGTEYYTGYILAMGRFTFPSSFVIPLNGRFTEVNGILGHVDGKYTADATMQIFFDGVLQQHLTKQLHGGMIPEAYSISVEGVQRLKIQMARATGTTTFGYADVTVK